MKTKTNFKLILISIFSTVILGAVSFFIFHIAYGTSYTINLSWSASTDNVAVTGYKVYRDGVQIGTSGTNSYSDTGLPVSTTYVYTVSAYDGAGNNSAQSSPVSFTTPDATTTTTQPTGSGGLVSNGGDGTPQEIPSPINNNEIGGGDEPPSTITPPVEPPLPSPVEIPVGTTQTGCTGTNAFDTATGQACVNNPFTVTVEGVTYNLGSNTLKFWSRGETVKDLQRFLNKVLDLSLAVDGILGPKTTAVIKIWQSNNGLVADGLVGPKTKAKMTEYAN